MKKRTFYFLCIALVLSSGIGMFLLKHYVLSKEKELTGIYRQIHLAEHEMHILSAEWAYHTDPTRLRQMAKQLNLSVYHGNQIKKGNELEDRSVPTDIKTSS